MDNNNISSLKYFQLYLFTMIILPGLPRRRVDARQDPPPQRPQPGHQQAHLPHPGGPHRRRHEQVPRAEAVPQAVRLRPVGIGRLLKQAAVLPARAGLPHVPAQRHLEDAAAAAPVCVHDAKQVSLAYAG